MGVPKLSVPKTLRFWNRENAAIFNRGQNKTLRFFLTENLGTWNCFFSILPETGRQIWHHHWAFSNNKHHYCFWSPTPGVFVALNVKLAYRNCLRRYPQTHHRICSLCRKNTKKQKKTLRFGICDFETLAICDFILRFSAIFLRNLQWELRFWICDLKTLAIAIAIFWDAKFPKNLSRLFFRNSLARLKTTSEV